MKNKKIIQSLSLLLVSQCLGNNYRSGVSLASKMEKRKPFLQNLARSVGFTLLELLVVILIIGILAAIVLPQYQKVVMKSHYANLMAVTEAVGKAEEIYFMDHGVYSDNFNDLLIIPSGCTISEDQNICTYEWGSCYLHSGVGRVSCVNNTNLNNGYVYYLSKGSYANYQKACWSLGSRSTDTKWAQLCKRMGATKWRECLSCFPYGECCTYSF